MFMNQHILINNLMNVESIGFIDSLYAIISHVEFFELNHIDSLTFGFFISNFLI